MNHIMIDIECFGTNHNAAIASIGACEFSMDPATLQDKERPQRRTFHMGIRPLRFESNEMMYSHETICWWLKQSDKARAALVFEIESGQTLNLALRLLHDWLNFWKPATRVVWAKPAMFDLLILQTAYQRLDLPCPWESNKTSCMSQFFRDKKRPKIPKNDLKHDALSDAIHQSQVLEAYAVQVAEAPSP